MYPSRRIMKLQIRANIGGEMAFQIFIPKRQSNLTDISEGRKRFISDASSISNSNAKENELKMSYKSCMKLMSQGLKEKLMIVHSSKFTKHDAKT